MTWGVPLLVSYHLAFHTVHGVLKARILKWLAIPFSSGSHSVRPLHHDPSVLGCPTGMAWFHWVRQGCGPTVIRLTSFCEYGFSVSALWCPLATLTLEFLLPWAWGISSRLLQQSTAAVPYLGWGVSPYRRRSWPSTWDSSSRPSCACAATTLQIPGTRKFSDISCPFRVIILF